MPALAKDMGQYIVLLGVCVKLSESPCRKSCHVGKRSNDILGNHTCSSVSARSRCTSMSFSCGPMLKTRLVGYGQDFFMGILMLV